LVDKEFKLINPPGSEVGPGAAGERIAFNIQLYKMIFNIMLDKDNMIYDIDVYIVLGKYTYFMVRNSNTKGPVLADSISL
jgi:hypothetical protein